MHILKVDLWFEAETQSCLATNSPKLSHSSTNKKFEHFFTPYLSKNRNNCRFFLLHIRSDGNYDAVTNETVGRWMFSNYQGNWLKEDPNKRG